MHDLSIERGNLIDKGFNRPEISVLFKGVRFLEKLESFFDSLENQFHWDHFGYSRMLALLRFHGHVILWPIEVFFEDSKQLLGLGQYQNVSYEMGVDFWPPCK